MQTAKIASPAAEEKDSASPPSRRNPSPSILVADDQADVRESLHLLLKANGYQMVGAKSPDEALACLRGRDFAAALIDMNYQRDTTSGVEGLNLIKQIHALTPELPLITMTAWSSVELAVEAMRLGASDFIEKPWQNMRLLSVLDNQCALYRSRRQAQQLSEVNQLLMGEADTGFIAESPRMRRLLSEVMQISRSDASVLLLGENGTGKSAIARMIHRWSARQQQAFVKVNIGSLAANVFESELFGHVRGAYTDAKSERIGRFELADGGTLFLDEIGNLPLEQQAKLLRVIEDGEFERLGSSHTQRVDVRLIAATNVDLAAKSRSGEFREDLLYRINTLPIQLPPLRERREDIAPLARHYLAILAKRYQREGVALGAASERHLLNYPWPGNVRELAHVMERAVLLARSNVLQPEDLRLQAGEERSPPFESMTLREAERWLLQQSLQCHHGNLQHSAEQLGLTRQSLYRRLQKHRIRIDDAVTDEG